MGITVLEAAQDAGIKLQHGCLVGTCRLCRTRLLKGKIEYLSGFSSCLSDAEVAENYFLPCCATATSDIVCEQDVWSTTPKTHKEGSILLDKQLYGKVFVLTLQLSAHTHINPIPGQYIYVESSCGISRAYSIANIPQVDGRIELHVRWHDNGIFSHYVCDSINIGDVLWIYGPYGDFILNQNSSRSILFIATGTGFSPIKAILESGAIPRDRIIKLYWGGRGISDWYFKTSIANLSSKYDNFEFVPVLSRPDILDCWSGRIGHVQNWIESDINDLSGYDVYACGTPDMISDTFELLVARCRLSADQFRADSFYCTVNTGNVK